MRNNWNGMVVWKTYDLSQHMHDNAFDGVWFGVNPHGILGAIQQI